MESRPCLKLVYIGQGSKSQGQIVENNVQNFFHTQAYRLKVKAREF